MYTKKNHRQRVKERFRAEGLDDFDQVHALELLLFYAIPQKDTKQLARDLLDRFGSFHGVLEATPEELAAVPGVGENVATFLNLVLAAGRYYDMNRTADVTVLNDSVEYGNYLISRFKGRRNEMLYLLCLDAKGKLLCCKQLGEGDVVSINLPIRRVVEIALSVKASAVVLAHNHPSGLAVPSPEDMAVTKHLRQTLEGLGIVLADHILVSENEFISMAQSRGWL